MAESASPKPRLDDVMLAMDVVDTLRHESALVERELAADDRDARLMDRLREIYAAQGIEVPDHILAEGVAALREDRFRYDPPKPGLAVSLARLYVTRGRWGWPVAGIAGIALALVLGYGLLVSGPEQRRIEALPEALAARHGEVVEVSRSAEAAERAGVLYADAKAALERGDAEAAQALLDRLDALRRELLMEYELRVVSGPGERSGVWRVPAANPQARNHYLIVEAVDADGAVLRLPVTSEEDGRTRTVERWGLRVSEDDFRAVAADKNDDGIIQNRRVGIKRRGQLQPEYRVATSGAAITDW